MKNLNSNTNSRFLHLLTSKCFSLPILLFSLLLLLLLCNIPAIIQCRHTIPTYKIEKKSTRLSNTLQFNHHHDTRENKKELKRKTTIHQQHNGRDYHRYNNNRIGRKIVGRNLQEQKAIIPTFSLPSQVNLYTNMPLNIPIVLTNEVTQGTTFEYSWKITNSTYGLTLASGTTPTISVSEYDLDVLKQYISYRNIGETTVSSTVFMWTISVEVVSKGDYGVLIAHYSQSIPFNLSLLGVYAGIVGENQNLAPVVDIATNEILNLSMTTVTPIIEYYDSSIKNIVKERGECAWTCSYSLYSDPFTSKACSNFEQLQIFSKNNCKSFNLIGKTEESMTTIFKFNIGILYRYDSFYYVESPNYELSVSSVRSDDFVPILKSISSNSTMRQYHPPNTPITLTPTFDNYNSTARVIFYWDVDGTPLPRQNLTLSSLIPNRKYVATCMIYFLGNIQKFSSMSFTFYTANAISKPKLNIVTQSAKAFQTRVQISGFLGQSNTSTSNPLCMTEIYAETATNGRITLSNGRYLCLQSMSISSSEPILFVRLPLTRTTLSNTLKVVFIVTDGISQETYSVSTNSEPSTIIDNFSSDNIIKVANGVLDPSSAVYENDKTLLPSHIVVAASIVLDFKQVSTEAQTTTSDSTLASGLALYLPKICPSTNSYLAPDDNLNCIEMIARYLSVSKLTSTFSKVLLSPSTSSGVVRSVFYQLSQYVYNTNSQKGTLQADVLVTKFLSEGGSKYIGALIDMLQLASNYISQETISITVNGTLIYVNTDSIAQLSYDVSKLVMEGSASTFKSSTSLLSKVDLSTLLYPTTYSLPQEDGITVQLPSFSASFLSSLTLNSAVVVSLQLTPYNNITDDSIISNSTQNSLSMVSSRKVQFQLLDPTTYKKIELVNLPQPITLKLPLFTPSNRAFSNESRANSLCVFWKDASSSWSTDGCILKQTTLTNFYCECNHTTIFSVLSTTSSSINNGTEVVKAQFDMVPLIVISSVTGGVILFTLGLATIIQAFIHILKTVDSAESGDLFLPAEFFPVKTKSPEKPKEENNQTTIINENDPKPEEPEAKPKKRYRDLSFGLKIFECLKEFHPLLGLVFPKRYFKRVHTKKIDRLILLMVIFIGSSTGNVILLSVSTVTANWIFVIPSLISFGFSLLNQIPITIFFALRQVFWKVCAYGYSCIFAFICLIISILASAGVFVKQEWNMNILNWLYATILSLVWDLLIFKVAFAAVLAFLLEVKFTIELGIESFKKKTDNSDTTDVPPQPTKRMVTVENNARIPLLFSQKEKPVIPKLNLRVIEGVATPKENVINELSSLHASPTQSDATSSSDGLDSYFSPKKSVTDQSVNTMPLEEPTKTEAASSSSVVHSSEHTSKESKEAEVDNEPVESLSPGNLILDSPGCSPISPLVPKNDHDMSFVDLQLAELNNEQVKPAVEEHPTNIVEDTLVEEKPVMTECITEEDPPEAIVVDNITPIVAENQKTNEVVIEEVTIPETSEESDNREATIEVDQVVIQEISTNQEENSEIPVEKPNSIKILKDILKDKERRSQAIISPPTLDFPSKVDAEPIHQEPKEKSEKDILEYIQQVTNNENNLTENTDIFATIPTEKLTGKTISEIFLILSESQPSSTQPVYSSPLRTNSPVARNQLQRSNSENKSARMLRSGGIEVDRNRKRSQSFHKLYGIEEDLIKPQTDFIDQLRLFILNNYSGEVKTKAINEILFLQCIYLHYKIISVTPENRKLMAEQIVSTFLNDTNQHHINIGFYKRVLSSCVTDDGLNANTFERACEIIEIALKPIISNFFKHIQHSQSVINTV